jgi:5-methylcytosine-specific restriction endonuclease McrA
MEHITDDTITDDTITDDTIIDNSIKKLSLPEPKKKVDIVPKIKKDRVITQTIKWTFGEPELLFENQWKLINNLNNSSIIENDNVLQINEIKPHPHILFIHQQLKHKLYGYYYQDLKKKKYSEELFIKLENIVKLLIDCKFNCYYCKNKVQVLYQHVREASQWTLERIDNEFGHNEGNVVIACLQCNLKRKTMYHERFVFTKQIKIVKEIREPSL